jgi:hypothetical protein
MAKKQWIFLAVFLLLAAVYICTFTNWGRHPAIQISYAADLKPRGVIRPRLKGSSINTANVRFDLDHPRQLTEVKVVKLSDWLTNKYTLPVWHLVSDSNSVPTKWFYYGVPIRGMKPAVAKIWPMPLETNVAYRLFLTAGTVKGQHDFSPPAR